MKNYEGELLVVHGKNDEVINISNAANLVSEYECQGKKNKQRECFFIQVPRMTHNNYEKKDLVDPISSFFN